MKIVGRILRRKVIRRPMIMVELMKGRLETVIGKEFIDQRIPLIATPFICNLQNEKFVDSYFHFLIVHNLLFV